MRYSKTGLQLTERFEGCKLTAYQDQVGRWTIGYGHAENVTPGLTITPEQAEAFLIEDTQAAAHCVNELVKAPLTQDEFDSLVDFTYNVGRGALAESTMLKLLNAGDYRSAAEQFDRWSDAGGHEVAGLLRRREAETQEFNAT